MTSIFLIGKESVSMYLKIIFEYKYMINYVFRLGDGLRSTNRLQALTLLGHVVKRQPTWLFKITSHYLMKELIKLLKV